MCLKLEKSQACSSFILLQLEYNCKPDISKIVYELTGLS